MGLIIGTGGTSTGSSGNKAILVKAVQAGDSFPTTRQDGSALVLGDWVVPKGTLPFTIGTVTFTNAKDTASWTGVEWLLNANPFQKTNETPVNNKSTESISGTANYQSNINAENKTAINKKVEQGTQTSGDYAYVRQAGVEGTYPMSPSVTADTLAQRGTGGTLKVGTPSADNDAATKEYADDGDAERIEHLETLPTATVAMIGKPCVQYVGADDTALGLTHNRFYEVVADGSGAKWQECQVSEGVKPYLNGVLLDGNKNTEQVRISFKGTRAEWDALSSDEKKCRFAVLTDEDAVPQLHITLVVNTTTGKLKAQLWDVTDTTKVAESNEVLVQDNEALHSGAFLTEIPAGESGAGKHGLKFTKADGTFLYLALEDETDKLVTALDSVTLKNKTINADDNTVSNLETDNFKSSAISTAIPSTGSVDTKLPTEKAVRDAVDDMIDDSLATSTAKTYSIDKIKQEIQTAGATFRGAFADKAALDAYTGDKDKNDRAIVTADEDHSDSTTLYSYDGTDWAFEYVISTKPIEADGTTIEFNSDGKLGVKDEGINLAKFAKHTSDAGKAYVIKDDGTTELRDIKQYERVSSFGTVTGNTYTEYFLDTPCIIGTKSYAIGLYVWDSTNGFKQVADLGGGGGGSTPILVGIVSPGGFMPTIRPDGNALVIGDYVKPYSGATFPFTVSGVTFNSANDTAVYMTGGNWLVNATVYQKTAETPVSGKADESINGSTSTAVYQSDINKENKTAINAAAKAATFGKTDDGKVRLNIKDRSGSDIVDSSVEGVVFEDDTQTLTNKTIDADDNTVSNIETDNLKSSAISTTIPDDATAAVDTKLATEKAVRTETGSLMKTGTFEKTSEGKVHLNLKDRNGDDVVEVSIDEVVFELDDQKLTNKQMSADDNEFTEFETDNFKSGVIDTDIDSSSTDTQLPTAKAAYTLSEKKIDKALHISNPTSIDDMFVKAGIAALDYASVFVYVDNVPVDILPLGADKGYLTLRTMTNAGVARRMAWYMMSDVERVFVNLRQSDDEWDEWVELTNQWVDVVDNLNSTASDKALSAKQGNALNAAKVEKSLVISEPTDMDDIFTKAGIAETDNAAVFAYVTDAMPDILPYEYMQGYVELRTLSHAAGQVKRFAIWNAPDTITDGCMCIRYCWNGVWYDWIEVTRQGSSGVEIVDNLTTEDATKALSAKQGKVLNTAKLDKVSLVESATSLDDIFEKSQISDSNSSGAYIRLSATTIGLLPENYIEGSAYLMQETSSYRKILFFPRSGNRVWMNTKLGTWKGWQRVDIATYYQTTEPSAAVEGDLWMTEDTDPGDYLPLSGGTMTGDIVMGSHDISMGGRGLDGDGKTLMYASQNVLLAQSISFKVVKGSTDTVSAGSEVWKEVTITPDTGYVLIGYGGAYAGANGCCLVSNRVMSMSATSMKVQIGVKNTTSESKSVTVEAYAMQLKIS